MLFFKFGGFERGGEVKGSLRSHWLPAMGPPNDFRDLVVQVESPAYRLPRASSVSSVKWELDSWIGGSQHELRMWFYSLVLSSTSSDSVEDRAHAYLWRNS